MEPLDMTQENNVMIALFDGARVVGSVAIDQTPNLPTQHYFKTGFRPKYYLDSQKLYFVKGEELRYNHDWNWLMAVVDKIEKMGYLFSMCRDWAEVDANYDIPEERQFTQSFSADTRIEAVYACVVAFIEWYNANPVTK